MKDKETTDVFLGEEGVCSEELQLSTIKRTRGNKETCCQLII